MTIFLGSIYPQALFERLREHEQYIDYPANVFQYSLLKGLDNHITDLRVITSPVIKSSYKSVKEYCKKKIFSHQSSSNQKDIYVGTLPIRGLQMIIELWRVYKETRNTIKERMEDKSMIIYSLHSPFLLAGVLLKNKFKCISVVVPDLPEYMSTNCGPLRQFAKKIDRIIINYCIKRLDCYILLSPHMLEKLPIRNKPHVIVEGIYDMTICNNVVHKCKERVIFYGGNLSRRYGLLDLIEAFKCIDNENYRLWICGDGDTKEEVLKLVKQDKRVHYYGVVSHSEVLLLQQQATVLINPRNSSEDYTRYSFPSKTMEYLASGTPTIMCHLPAIPKEYDEYIYYISNENAIGIKNKILEVCEKPQWELDEFGQKAANFIMTRKNSNIQAQRIVDMINTFCSYSQ